ncbi:MAG: SurA N-terminal domain-containing protein [Nitrospirota bacterium]|nr:SurA N-terminal domain-containing protein [Nitrospirota bacterium]
MLQFMHKHAKYFYVFFFLVIISFIFLYVGPLDQNQSPVVAEVGKEKIPLDEYWRAYDRFRNFYKEMYKEKFDKKMEEQLNLKQKVLETLIEERILRIEAEKLGLKVSDRELQEAIMSDPAFKRDGVFRRDVYLQTLRINRLTPGYYESMKRQELLVGKVRALIGESVVLTDDDLKGLKGDESYFNAIRDAMLKDKQQKLLRSYVETLKKSINVKVNTELIS